VSSILCDSAKLDREDLLGIGTFQLLVVLGVDELPNGLPGGAASLVQDMDRLNNHVNKFAWHG